MIELRHRLEDPMGLHARSAVRLAAEAKRWASQVVVSIGERRASGDEPAALLALDARAEDEIAVCVEGPDEASAADALRPVVESL